MEFSEFAARADEIEAEEADLETVELVAELLEAADEDLETVARFVQGRVFPAHDGTKLDVAAGEGFFVPSGEPHAAENVGNTVVRGIDVFAPARSADYWSE